MDQSDPQGPTKTIRALERGLHIVELLSRRGQMTLADLRRATGLANPTLLRVLRTLQARSWVRRTLAEGRYELAHSLSDFLSGGARAHPLAEFAAPFALDLKGQQSGWPSDICGIIAPGQIEIVESTRLRGPMALTRSSLGIRPSMVMSAHGRAVFAFATPAQQDRHLAAVRTNGTRQEVRQVNSDAFRAEIERSRNRGYALREAEYWQPPFEPGPEHGALAVPILSGGGLHGTISLLWIVEEVSLEDVLASGALEDLQTAADRIGAELQANGVRPPLV